MVKVAGNCPFKYNVHPLFQAKNPFIGNTAKEFASRTSKSKVYSWKPFLPTKT